MNDSKPKLKISLCTVCMNRLNHLAETLPKNLQDNLSYGNIEFVVLDYGSEDGMGDWIKEHMSDHIEAGILVYVKVNDVPFFHMSHSKNVAAKCATGDIICNVDADNYVGKGFAEYLNNVFSNEKKTVLTVDRQMPNRDVMGRISLRRKDFIDLGGYNEDFLYYSYEDSHFLNKAVKNGFELKFIEDDKFLNAISHSNFERFEHGALFNKVFKIYFKYVSTEQSDIIILYKDNTVEFGSLMIDRAFYGKFKFPLVYDFSSKAQLKNNKCNSGEWEISNNSLYIKSDEKLSKTYSLKEDGSMLEDEDLTPYTHITSKDFTLTLIYTWSTAMNLSILEKGFVKKSQFGNALIYKNFSAVSENI